MECLSFQLVIITRPIYIVIVAFIYIERIFFSPYRLVSCVRFCVCVFFRRKYEIQLKQHKYTHIHTTKRERAHTIQNLEIGLNCACLHLAIYLCHLNYFSISLQAPNCHNDRINKMIFVMNGMNAYTHNEVVNQFHTVLRTRSGNVSRFYGCKWIVL